MMIKIVGFIFLICLSCFAFAQGNEVYLQGEIVEGPYATNVVAGGELTFLKTRDPEFPLSLVLDLKGSNSGQPRQLVDKYDVAGSDPKIESIFYYSVKNKRNVLVLVSWELTSRGAGTYGTLYQVYGYEKGANDELVINKIIRFDSRLSGIDGYQEGVAQSFPYKNAALIKAYIKKSINN